MSKKRKAYRFLDEDADITYLEWFESAGQARAYFANECGLDFTDVHVYREPWADAYNTAEEIPVEAYLKNGWYWPCANCGERIYEDDKYNMLHNKVYCERCYNDYMAQGDKKMAENKMAEVVKLLNVEIGEEFLVFNDMGELVGKHKFDDKNLWVIDDNRTSLINNHLVYLLNGAWTIKKKPWKPMKNERYYTFKYIKKSLEVELYQWSDDVFDILAYRNGFCFKTEEEAEAALPMAEKFFNSDDIIDWE